MTKKKTTTESKPKRGRPSIYTKAIADAICARLAQGQSLRSICEDPKMPKESTVRQWAVEDYKGFYAQYARARDIGLDSMADELLDISDDGTNDWMKRNDPENDGYVFNGEHATRSRLRVDTRKWYLSKLAPKRYGEKLTAEIANKDGESFKTEAVVEHKVAADAADIIREGLKSLV